MGTTVAISLLVVAVVLFVAAQREWISDKALQRLANVAAIVALLAAIFMFVVPSPTNGPGDTPATVASMLSSHNTPALTPTSTSMNTPTPTPTPTSTNTPMPTPTPTLTNTSISPTPTQTLEPGATRIVGENRIVMVYIPAGEFLMGSNDRDTAAEADEKPPHTVYLDAFWIDQTEVTNAQYNRCVEAWVCPESGSRTHLNDYPQPVVSVSWDMAKTYCEWLGKVTGKRITLPSEAEWEKAARGTDSRIYPWGNQKATCEYAVMQDSSGKGCGKDATWSVGSKPEGASPYGVLDMTGNVAEWVADRYRQDYYGVSPTENPTGPPIGQYRVLRGGGWDAFQTYFRAADRHFSIPTTSYEAVGFRCVMKD